MCSCYQRRKELFENIKIVVSRGCACTYTCWHLRSNIRIVLLYEFVSVCVWERHTQRGGKVFKVFTWVATLHVCLHFHLFLALQRTRACVHSHILWSQLCHAWLPVTLRTPTSTELWPHTFLPRALLSPFLCPFVSSSPCLSLFCVSTDVWNYSGMEGWIPPWWAEWRREPFVQ